MKLAAMIGALFLPSMAAPAIQAVSNIHRDETVLFAPSSGRVIENGSALEIRIDGVVYEIEPRRLTLGVLKESLALAGTEFTPEQEEIFRQRGRLFLVDNERRKSVVIRLGGQTFNLGRTRADGRFSSKIRYPLSPGAAPVAALTFVAMLPETDDRMFEGRCLIQQSGVPVVVSDIDDTIKVTGVADRPSMLKNTFLEPYRAVPGMAELYQELAARGAFFHYLSASPWQLYIPLNDFCQTSGFPPGIFHLKPFRLKDRSFFSLFQNPEKYKKPILEKLIKEAPDSRFILIGDASESDPEIYTAIAREFPRQVVRILIRTQDAAPESSRYEQLAAGIPPGCLVFFSDPAQLRTVPLLPEAGPRF